MGIFGNRNACLENVQRDRSTDQWRNFGLKSGGDKNFGRLFGSVYSTPRSLGGKLTWLGDGGKGVRGSALSSPGGVWGRAPAVGGPGVKPPGKFLKF
jgi:hypothetical protein